MTDRPDPDQTREIPVPPPAEAPTRQFGNPPPPPGPTRQLRTPPPPRPVPPRPVPPRPVPPRPVPARPHQRTGDEQEPPWWQTIHRDRMGPPPAPPVRQVPPPPPPPPARAHPPHPVPRPPNPPAPPRSTAPKQRRSRLFLAAGLTAAVAITIAAVAIVARPANSSSKVLDVGKAQQGVAEVLADPVNGYGLTSLGAVRCNNGTNPVVRQGNSFTCDVSVEGVQRQVTVVFQDGEGTYAVDRPR